MNERLYELRTERGLSRLALARQCGVSDRTITRIENEAQVPTTGVRRKVAEFFGVSVEWLFGVSNEPRRCLVCGAEIPEKARRFCSQRCGAAYAYRHGSNNASQNYVKSNDYPVPPSLPLPMPCVGERRMETMTVGRVIGGEPPVAPCTVVQVEPIRGWYRVVFDRSGVTECYNVPNTDPQSRKIKQSGRAER